MTEKRKKEIIIEAERRIKLWLDNSTFDKMAVFGVRYTITKFDMSIGLFGYEFVEIPEWMNIDDFKQFVTEDEFESSDYYEIIHNLFVKYTSLDNKY
jgi:hypothetical protein